MYDIEYIRPMQPDDRDRPFTPNPEPWPLPIIDENMRARLANGARLRAEMQRQLDLGQVPSGYRARWLQESAKAIIALLAERGAQFNAAHEDDAASLADVLDA